MSNERAMDSETRQDHSSQMVHLGRSGSMEHGSERKYHGGKSQLVQQIPQPPYGYHHEGPPPVYYPRRPNHYHQYPPPPPPQTRGSHRLRSVVTDSFSVEDEREDTSGQNGYGYNPRHQQHDDRHPMESNSRREGTDEREAGTRNDNFNREAPHADFDARVQPEIKAQPVRIPPSPSDARTGGEDKRSPNMKRSFWHHARPGDSVSPQTHPAFLPPKRIKTNTASRSQGKEVVVTPRTPGGGYDYSRANSWSAPDSDQYRHYHQTYSFPSPWHQVPRPSRSFGGYPEVQRDPSMEEHYGRPYEDGYGNSNRAGAFRPMPSDSRAPPPRSYPYPGGPQGSFPPPPPHQPIWSPGSYDWTGSMASGSREWMRDDLETRDLLRSRSYSRDTSWDERDPGARRQGVFDYYGAHYGSTSPDQSGWKQPGGVYEHPQKSTQHLRLLAQPDDRISLSETLCTIRENIEVFCATKADVEAPAPGRKHPVVVGQVGLRCIHCRHTTKSSDRVKRAVCYPSSIKRIYRTVIDMKLDHFQHCRFVPKALKDRLEELKAINTRSTGTTMQYFVKAAKKMGMVDATTGTGVRMVEDEKTDEKPPKAPASPGQESPEAQLQLSPAGSTVSNKGAPASPGNASAEGSIGHASSNGSIGSGTIQSDASYGEEPSELFMGKTLLSLPEDKMALSPLRCFLRENVFAFSATEEDIAVRTPTTFSVAVGQVGIGCVHCYMLPAKQRSNRAVCFPFSVNRIYQSVADIQRFHMSECKMIPPEVRERFQKLQSASSKGSKGLATRQYWVTSAKKIGLIDTAKGIRFNRDPSVPTTQAVSLDILAQVASNVTTINRPLVLPEDKGNIADFLYVVMEQLQACRFTEADRNKRRVKDVGCIGVECKHCAGQVESRKFFWSSVNAVESNFVSVHTHMMECRMVPPELKENLSELKKLRKEQTSRLKTGSQKAFFHRVWKRLHTAGEDEEVESNDSDSMKTEVEAVTSAVGRMNSGVEPATDGGKKMDVVLL